MNNPPETINKESSSSIAVWAIADLHLSFGVKEKKMDFFGSEWSNWTKKIQDHWTRLIAEEDLVLIPGDISWALHPEEAVPDLEWIDSLPGTKVMIRGNHDYWWGSLAKVKKILPASVHIIQNDAFSFANVSVGGARLWDTPEYTFDDYIVFKKNDKSNALARASEGPEHNEKIFARDLHRLELSLKAMDQEAAHRIVMTHYPPISANLDDSRASRLLEQYNIDICVFGHLHSVRPKALPFGEKNGVQYRLTSCDYLDFEPLRIL